MMRTSGPRIRANGAVALRCIGAGAIGVIMGLVSGVGGAGAQTGHAASLPPLVAAAGPTVVHDTAYADVRTEVRSVDVPLTSLSLVILSVGGFPGSARNRSFGAHVHVRPCAADPTASGGHYANPAGDPGRPLAAREVWLDLPVDSLGRAVSIALYDWRIRKGEAGSVVIHAEPTNPTTGGAGARILCTTVALGS